MSPRVQRHAGTPWLVAGGVLSFLAAALHLMVIPGGPDWYRFFGAGKELARAAEQGSWMPPIVTAAIAAILALWGVIALSGAGRLRRLPLLRTALVAIAAIYLARGLLLVPLLLLRPDLAGSFELWSSLIVLAYGLAYAIGTALGWRALRPGAEPASQPAA